MRLFSAFSARVAGAFHSYMVARTISELQHLSDAHIAHLGITRAQIPAFVRSSLEKKDAASSKATSHDTALVRLDV